MKFKSDASEVFIPDGSNIGDALARTTHLAIGAHQDDLEIMAIDGILKCFGDPEKWFTGVVVTNGSGSPRSGIYKDYTDEEMMRVRVVEQKKAASIGEYASQIFLGYPSSAVKFVDNEDVVEDIIKLLRIAKPEIVYTHNLADKHTTHVAVVLEVIRAIRRLNKEEKPAKVYGCEVWRDLGWMLDEDKIVFDCSDRVNLQEALIGVFDSQISGGKRYDLATIGRRIANATYFASHDTDEASGLTFGMDLTPLIENNDLGISEYVQNYISRFSDDVIQMISALT
ncbi:PIG-L deacetylase family protein [Chloroflexota bacterium]